MRGLNRLDPKHCDWRLEVPGIRRNDPFGEALRQYEVRILAEPIYPCHPQKL